MWPNSLKGCRLLVYAINNLIVMIFTFAGLQSYETGRQCETEVGTAPLFSSGATSAAVFLIAEAEAPLLFSANSEKRQRRYI